MNALESALQAAGFAEERARRAGLPRDYWPALCDVFDNVRGMLRPGGKRDQDAYWAGEVLYAAGLLDQYVQGYCPKCRVARPPHGLTERHSCGTPWEPSRLARLSAGG